MSSLSAGTLLVVSLFAASPAFAQGVSLFPGWPTPVAAGKVARITVDDPSVVQATLNEKGGLILTGMKEGRTRVLVIASGEKAPRPIEVRVETEGWELVPVVVAAVDIPEESLLTPEMVTTRLVPRAFVTRSIAKPDAVKYLLNQPTNVPVFAGDYLLWSNFERKR